MSIFSDENKVSGSWASFKVVGDKVEGTLIDKRTTFNKLSGKDQIIYELKDSEDNIILVGGKPAVDAQMKHVRLGQIVGFEFTEERKATVPGHSPTKIIQIFANVKVVDEEWLAVQEAAKELGGTVTQSPADGSEEPSYEPVEDKVEEPEVPDFSEGASQAEEINTLAKAKLGAETDADVQAKVMESTKLAFIEDNYTAILEALKKL